MIPQLQQAAYDMYRDEGDTMRSNLGMLQGMDDTDYGRYRDDVGDYWTMLNYLYGKYNDWYPRAAEQLALQQAAALAAGGGSGSVSRPETASGNYAGVQNGMYDPRVEYANELLFTNPYDPTAYVGTDPRKRHNSSASTYSPYFYLAD